MKVAICTPVYADPDRIYTHCLAQLLIYTAKARPDIDLAYISTTNHLIPGRNGCAQRALEEGADYLLWIDADMTFPADGLARLLAHNREVVGCNCPTRVTPIRPTAYRFHGEQCSPVYPEAGLVSAKIIEKVAYMGFGFCLVNGDVMRRVGPFRPHPTSSNGLGEDIQFFEDVRGLGVSVCLDHALSEQIGHVGQAVYRLRDVETPIS